MSYRDVIFNARESKQLLSVTLELTYRCNWDCFFCYNDLSLQGTPLSTVQYETMLADLADMQVLHITLTGGEPLMHPDFFKIGALCREYGFVTRLKTNGHAMRGSTLKRIKNDIDPQMIEVSLHGACAETHERQTRIEGSFQRLVENIRFMKEAGLLVKVNSTLTKWNEDEVPEMFDLAESLNVPLQFDPEVTIRDDGDEEPLSIAASREGLKRLNDERTRRAQKYAELGVLPTHAKMSDKEIKERSAYEEKTFSDYCGAGVSALTVDPFGTVYPCVQWRVASGSLHESSIKSIWGGSDTLDEVRTIQPQIRQWVRDNNELPRKHAFCPGEAYSEMGSPLKAHNTFVKRMESLSGQKLKVLD